MNFEPTAEQSAAREMARTFADREIKPYWRAREAEARFHRDLIEKMAEAGLSAELVKLLKNPDNIERIKGIGFEPIPSSQEELAASLITEIARRGKVIREAGIKAD